MPGERRRSQWDDFGRPAPPPRPWYIQLLLSVWEWIKEQVAGYRQQQRDDLDLSQSGQPARGGKMKWLVRGVATFVTLFVAAFVLFYGFTVNIKPWKVGIKQVKWSMAGKEGYMPEIYEGGYRHFVVPFQETMHEVPINLQYIYIHTRVKPDGKVIPGTGLEVPTSDGSVVQNDIVVIWRVFPNAEYDEEKRLIHGGPQELRQTSGLLYANWERLISEQVQDRCKRALNALKVHDYYHSDAKEMKAQQAREWLNKGWRDDHGNEVVGFHKQGLDIVAILPGAYYFEERMHHAIHDKNIRDQEKMLNQAKDKYEENAAKVAKVEGEGNAAIKNKEIWGNNEMLARKSGADRYKRTVESNGDLLVKNAEASVKDMKAKALEEQGASLYVTEQMSNLPMVIKGGILSGMNPLNLDDWMVNLSGAEAVPGSKMMEVKGGKQ